MKKIILTLTMLVASVTANVAAIGTWTAYPAYYDITEVEQAGTTLYVLASKGLFSYGTGDRSVRTYDKVNALSDCEIAHIKWCGSARRLVIIYENQNIDLLNAGGTVTNISDYYNKPMTEDKTVNSIYVDGNYAYLSTGFGIIKLNVKDAEISDTYDLGFKVNYSYIRDGKIYAASGTNGLFAASTNSNLQDKDKWTRVGDYTPKSTDIDATLLATAKAANPGGPKYNHFHFMTFQNNRLYTSGGYFASGGEDMRYPGTIQTLSGDDWTIYEDRIDTITKYSYIDNNCVAVDPFDGNHVFAAGKTGLYEFESGKLKAYYNKDNSPLHGAIDRGVELDNNYVLIMGMTFDTAGNLWILNSQSSSNTILEYTKGGKWVSHHNTALMNGEVGLWNMTSPMIDSRGLMWLVNDSWSLPLLAYYNISSDKMKTYRSFVNEDGTAVSPSQGVRCVAEDLGGNIWVGTSAGPLLILSSQIGTDDDTFTQVKVPRNDGTNYADYLLTGVDITCIAIDGANRKWMGTNGNGVYTISSDNMTQVHHFTSSNSSLLSNIIHSISIDNATGRVFIGTDKGLCSYTNDATGAVTTMSRDSVYAYPNPVRPDYTGLISVVGLSYDADIKIVTSNGVLVNEGRSNGGMYTWDGCDTGGRQVASGVYMVQAATSEGDKGTVCKIAIVR